MSASHEDSTPRTYILNLSDCTAELGEAGLLIAELDCPSPEESLTHADTCAYIISVPTANPIPR